MLVIARAGRLQEWLQWARRALTAFVFITINTLQYKYFIIIPYLSKNINSLLNE